MLIASLRACGRPTGWFDQNLEISQPRARKCTVPSQSGVKNPALHSGLGEGEKTELVFEALSRFSGFKFLLSILSIFAGCLSHGQYMPAERAILDHFWGPSNLGRG